MASMPQEDESAALTPQQKAARTRARNKALKEAQQADNAE